MHLTHNSWIKTFDDVVRHVELEKDMIESFRSKSEAYVINVRVQKNQGSKRKFKDGRGKGKDNEPKKPKTN